MSRYRQSLSKKSIKKFSQRFINLTTATLFFATTFAGASPLLFASTANATSSNMTLFTETFNGLSGGSSSFTGSGGDTWSLHNIRVGYMSGNAKAIFGDTNSQVDSQATVTLPLQNNQTPTSLDFDCEGLNGNTLPAVRGLTVTAYDDSGNKVGNLSTETYCEDYTLPAGSPRGPTSPTSPISLPSDTRSIEFALIDNSGEIQIDNVTVKATETTADQLAFTTQQRSVNQNAVSDELTVQSEDSTGNALAPNESNTTLSLSSSSATGKFSHDGSTDWETGTTSSPASFTWNSDWTTFNFYYKDATPGTYTITAKLNVNNGEYTKSTTQDITINSTYTETAPPTMPTLSGNVIYNSISSPYPASYPSEGFEATGTSALGDKITFAGSDRKLDKAAVVLTSWACESGNWTSNCVTTPGATFSQDVTLNLYKIANGGSVGAKIKSVTQNFNIPYRPTTDSTCPTPTNWRDTNGNCHSGYNYAAVFDLNDTIVPNNVYYTVSFNTSSYGANPTGAVGPADSLNVGLNNDATSQYTGSVGQSVYQEATHQDTTLSGYHVAAMFTATPADTTGPLVGKLRNSHITIANKYKHTKNCDAITGLFPVRDNLNLTAKLTDNSGVASAYYKVRLLQSNGCTRSSGSPNGYNSGKVWLKQNNGNSNVWNQSTAFDTNNLNNGKYAIELVTKDSIGNTTHKWIDIYVDNTNPWITIKNGYVGSENKADYSNVSFKLHDNYGVAKYVLNEGTSNEFDHPLSFSKTSDANFGNIKGHLNEGSNTITLYDVAGNSASYDFTYDTHGPKVTISNPKKDKAYNNTVTVNGSVSDDYGVPTEVTVHLRHVKSNGKCGGFLNSLTASVDASGNWSTNFDSNAYDDGQYCITVLATDLAGNGNGGGAHLKSFIIDNSNPTITPVNYTGDISSKVFSKVSFSFYDKYNIVGFDLNGKYGSLSPNKWSNYDFSNLIKYFGMHDGSNTITAYDAAGNSSIYDFTLDTSAPDQVTGVKVSQGSNSGTHIYVNSRTVTVSWDGVVGASHYDYQAATDKNNPNFNTTVNGTSRSGDIQGNDGNRYYRVRAVDAAGNTGEWSDWVEATLDTKVPQLSVDAPANLVTNANTLDVTGTVYDTNLSEYRYQILDQNKQNTLGSIGWSRHGGSSNVNNGTLFTADISNLSDGTYYISVWANDKAGNATNILGNRLAAPYIMKFTVDRTTPVVTVTPAPGNSPLHGTEHFKITVTDDNLDVSQLNDVYVHIYKPGSSNSAEKYGDHVTFNKVSDTEYEGTFTVDTKDLNDGTYRLSLDNITDLAGNGAVSKGQIHFAPYVIDNTAPTVSLSTDASNPTNQVINITGSVSDTNELKDYNLSLYPGNVDLSDGGTHASNRIDLSGITTTGNWGTTYNSASPQNVTATLDTSGLATGDYKIRLAARDKAGNDDTSSVKVVTIHVDNSGPQITPTSITNADTNLYSVNGNTITPNFTDNDSDTTGYTYSWTGDASNPTGATFTNDVLNPAFTVTKTGDYLFNLVATDNLGNQTSVTFSFHYDVQQSGLGGGPGANSAGNSGTFSNVTGGVTPPATATPAVAQAVLGAQTNTPSNASSNKTGIRGDSTTKNLKQDGDTIDNSGAWLGLGWWWLLILAAIVALFWFIAGARKKADEK